MDEKLKEIEKLCKPIVDYIKENYNLHTTVVITEDYIKVESTEIGIPLKNKTIAPEGQVREQIKEKFMPEDSDGKYYENKKSVLKPEND